MSISSGHVYILENRAVSGLVLHLRNAENPTPRDSTCTGYPDLRQMVDTFHQQWLISNVNGQSSNVYTLRNLCSGTYLDLENGSKTEGALVQGHSAQPVGSEQNQQWIISSSDSKFVTIVNKASGTYLTLRDATGTHGTRVQGFKLSNSATQQWKLERVSCTASHIEGIVNRSQPGISRFKCFSTDKVYIVLNKRVREMLWEETGLGKMTEKRALFDTEDYGFVTKAKVATWANSYFRAEGFTILWGIMHVSDWYPDGRPHGYNWYLTENFNNIAFFNPKTRQDAGQPQIGVDMALF